MGFSLDELRKALPPAEFEKIKREYERQLKESAPIDLGGERAVVDNEGLFELKLVEAGIDCYERQYVFAPPRLWRFDFAFHVRGAWRFAVEIEGGIYGRSKGGPCPWCGEQKKGRHMTVPGFIGDIEKYNEAHMLGWSVFRATPAMVRDGRAVDLVRRAIEQL